jgi:type IV pilus assembly protein PilA
MGKKSQGFSLTEVLIAVSIMLTIAAIAVANFLHLRVAANQASAVSSVLALNAAETTYFSMFGGRFSTDMASLGPPQPGANATSTAAGLIDGVLAQGAKSGYLFSYSPGVADSTGRITAYVINAAPQAYWTGRNQYYSDQSGVVSTIDSAAATGNTPTACSESGNTVTVTSTLNPPVGSVIQWSGASPAAYNSSVAGWAVTDSSSTSFSFQNPTTGLGACTAMGSVSLP